MAGQEVQLQLPQSVPNAAASHKGKASGGSLMKITSGPTALAQIMIFQMMGMYAQITALEQKQAQSMIESQSKAAQGQAKATSDGAWYAAYGMFAAGALQATSGIASIGMDKLSSDAAERDQLGAQAKPIEQQLSPLNSIQKLDAETTPANRIVGSTDPAESEKQGLISQRLEEFKTNKFGPTKDELNDAAAQKKYTPEITKAAIEQYKLQGEDPTALGGSNVPTYSDFIESVTARHTTLSQEHLALAQRQSTAGGQVTAKAGNFSNMAQAGGSFAQGTGNAFKGNKDAAASLNSTTSQMAASASQSANQQLGASGQAEQQLIRALREYEQAGMGN
jgi:hypothetical protein